MFFVLQIIYDHIIAFNWFALIYVHTPFPTPLVATFGKDNHFLNMGSFFISINMVGCRLKIAWGRLVWVYYNRKDYYARSSRHFRVHFVVRVCCDSVVNSVEWALLTAMGKKGNHSQWQLQRHFAPWFSKFWNGESESIDFVTTLNWLLSSQVAHNASGFKPIYVTLFSLYPSILLGGEERQAKNTTQWPGQVLDPNLPTRN